MWRWLALACVAVALAACPSKKKPIAELIKADGPVERQSAGQTSWAGAAVGTKYFLGDAARTADKGATLELAGAARIAMQPYTVLRFGGSGGTARLEVELGAIEVSGGGNYGLSIGDVKLENNGTIRIAANAGHSNTVELVVGNAQITTIDGKTQTLQIGQIVGIELGQIKVETVADAGVADAPADAPAEPQPTSSDAEIEIKGKGAEIQNPGETKWTKLPPDTKTVPKGGLLRLDGKTTAKLTANGTSLDLAGGSRTKVQDNLIFGLELGSGTASVPAAASGKVGVPGGEVQLDAPKDSPGEAKIDVNARGEAKVAVLHGTAKLTGTGGAALDLARGESATMLKAGTINPGDVVIPKYFDFKVTVGADAPSFTIHDPTGSTALQFAFNGKCPGAGVIEVDKDSRFRTPRVSAGQEAANILMRTGGWAWRLRCESGGAPGKQVGSGFISVVRDSGTRPLPKEPPRFPIDADGRNYRVDYQSLIPNIKIKGAPGGSKYVLHLASGGSEQTLDSTTGSFDVPGKTLKEGDYTYWIERDGVKSKVSTLKIGFDQTAAQVYIESPSNGQPWGDSIDVRGATLPGWSAKIDVLDIPVDKNTRRFKASVQPPSAGNALAIRLSHPQRGIHYYLRRPTK